MKRTITFFLVLSILMTSFACSSKPLPETFTPLSVKFRNASLSAYPSQKLSLSDLWDDVEALLTATEWTENKTVTVATNDLILTVTDEKNNTYDFYDDSSADQPVVVITRNEDEMTFSYTISVELFEGFMLFMNQHFVQQSISITPIIGFHDTQNQERSIQDDSLLQEVKTLLRTQDWVLEDETPEGVEVFTLWNRQNDGYSIFNATPQDFVIVTRYDQSKYIYTIPDDVITSLSEFMVENAQETISWEYTPVSIYVGNQTGFDENKLVVIPETTVASYLVKRQLSEDNYTPIDSTLINPDEPILFMTKNADGLYTTVYKSEVESIDIYDWTYLVSIGKDPFHGPENVAFKLFGATALMDYALLALFPLDSTATLDFKIDTQTTYTFPQWSVVGDTRIRETSGKLNQEMIDYLMSFESEASIQDFYDQTQSLLDAFQFTLTTSNGTMYRFVYDGVFVDEDPQTPGAVFYRFSKPNPYSFSKMEYLAKLPSNYDPSGIKITEYKVPDTNTWVALTSTQSDAISQLLKDATWYGSEFSFQWGGEDPNVILKTSTGDVLTFLYWASGDDQGQYRVIILINYDYRCYMPFEEFIEIFELFETFKP